MLVATANVNGIRAACRKGFDQWLVDRKLDVVCLQEVRAQDAEIPTEIRGGWHIAHAEAAAKGRNGVAVFSRVEPTDVRSGIGSKEFDPQGRYIEVDLPGLIVASLYMPKGEAETDKQVAKARFMKPFLPYLRALARRAAEQDRDVIVAGDWNIAHREADLKNWRANRVNSGFLPEERAWLDKLYGPRSAYVDVVRAVHPDTEGPYSWWSYRGRAYDNNVGWRIDHLAVTRRLAAKARTAQVDRAATWDTRFSDHSPVLVDFDV
ncbi:exodeoxyribonuclease III [Fodinicola feengrottensis]|uniref:Exodeoxyribonuclease III n=1 Tax=Fodinicola feengrottensis TaxID=435914 RepID=A0ABP4TD37_9ACTN